jgi:DUF4097 and DUF4098 domain-containing protein YvlB
MKHLHRSAQIALIALVTVATVSMAETRKEFRFVVGPNSTVSVANQYGQVTAKPVAGNQVLVTAVLYSDKVEVDRGQSANHISLTSHLLPGADQQSGRVDYEVLVPVDANVTLHSQTGPLHAERLRGDVVMEGASAPVEVIDIANSHVHVKTMDGKITVTNLRDNHAEISSVSGDIVLSDVNSQYLQVSSTSGNISYDGDFGSGGEYAIISHSGNIQATVPPGASFKVTARTVKGKVESDIPFQPAQHMTFQPSPTALAGSMGKAASSVVLRTFTGKIHLQKR